jgi:hypothetical protein
MMTGMKMEIIKNNRIYNEKTAAQQTRTNMLLMFITSKKTFSLSRRLKYPKSTVSAIPDMMPDGVNTEINSVFHFRFIINRPAYYGGSAKLAALQRTGTYPNLTVNSSECGNVRRMVSVSSTY